MKKIVLTAVVVAAAFAGMPAFSAETATITKVEVETVKSLPVVQQNVLVAPETCAAKTISIQKTDEMLVPSFQPSVFVVNPTVAFTSMPGVMIEVVRPDDLIQRQADLNARILVEQSAGTLSAAQANELLGRLSQVALIECNMKANGTLTWKQVEHTYRAFDRISHDLDNYSTDTDHRLAGSWFVL